MTLSLLPDKEKYIYILSIDIGIIHMSFILLECNQDYTLHDIIYFELIDITTFHHLEKDQQCTIPHTKTFSDWLQHLFLLHGELFDLSKHILIERQPPGGHVVVEQLIFFKYREKAVLIHPRSVHKYMGWSIGVDYEGRKVKSVEAFKYRLEKLDRSWLVDYFNRLERQHDISDAYVQFLFFIHHKQEELRKNRPYTNTFLDQYKCEYKPFIE